MSCTAPVGGPTARPQAVPYAQGFYRHTDYLRKLEYSY
ncbi:hypothetical protein Lepto7375DRAFT_0296 [Leptolyngbya sp. PCC 7375]|nr:hypothetical protein Lepto7375DRAFT_0296 [Leptolyngbya sp. PCC 7375]